MSTRNGSSSRQYIFDNRAVVAQVQDIGGSWCACSLSIVFSPQHCQGMIHVRLRASFVQSDRAEFVYLRLLPEQLESIDMSDDVQVPVLIRRHLDARVPGSTTGRYLTLSLKLCAPGSVLVPGTPHFAASLTAKVQSRAQVESFWRLCRATELRLHVREDAVDEHERAALQRFSALALAGELSAVALDTNRMFDGRGVRETDADVFDLGDESCPPPYYPSHATSKRRREASGSPPASSPRDPKRQHQPPPAAKSSHRQSLVPKHRQRTHSLFLGARAGSPRLTKHTERRRAEGYARRDGSTVDGGNVVRHGAPVGPGHAAGHAPLLLDAVKPALPDAFDRYVDETDPLDGLVEEATLGVEEAGQDALVDLTEAKEEHLTEIQHTAWELMEAIREERRLDEEAEGQVQDDAAAAAAKAKAMERRERLQVFMAAAESTQSSSSGGELRFRPRRSRRPPGHPTVRPAAPSHEATDASAVALPQPPPAPQQQQQQQQQPLPNMRYVDDAGSTTEADTPTTKSFHTDDLFAPAYANGHPPRGLFPRFQPSQIEKWLLDRRERSV